MSFSLLAWLSNPITWMIAMMLFASGVRALRTETRSPEQRERIVHTGNAGIDATAAALMFVSTAYRPSTDFVAKAQIQQQEEADDDEQGGPDSAKKLFQRQLRQVQNGEQVDRLVWRLE